MYLGKPGERGTPMGNKSRLLSVVFAVPLILVSCSNQPKVPRKLWQISEPVVCHIFSPDGRFLLLLRNKEVPIEIRDVENGSLVHSIGDFEFSDFSGEPLCSSFAFSPDGRMLVIGSQKQQVIKAWNTKDLVPLWSTYYNLGTYDKFVFSADGEKLFVVKGDGGISELSVVGGWEERTIDCPECRKLRDNGGEVTPAISPKGDLAAFPTFEGTVKLIRTEDGAIVQTLHSADEELYPVGKIMFSPNGNYLLAEKGNNAFRGAVWKLPEGRFLRMFSVVSWDGVAVSADGAFIAVFAQLDIFDKEATKYDKEAKIGVWPIDRHTPLLKYPVKVGDLESRDEYEVSFSNGGSFVAIAGPRVVKVWRTFFGELQATIIPEWNIYGVTLSPNGSILALTVSHNWLQVWRVLKEEGVGD
jgi:WD40 repeat protein